MPTGLVRAYVRMLPRLTAEASIAAAERTGVGIGLWRSPEGARKAIETWQRVASAAPPGRTSDGLQARRVVFRGGAEALISRVDVQVEAPTLQAAAGEAAIAGPEV